MENSLDILLAPALRKSIEDNLGKITMNKIEQRLMERHGIGVVQAIKEFSKLDSVLQEFFGAGAEGLESRFIQNIIKLESSKKESENWIVLKDQILAKTVLESFADEEKKSILEVVMNDSLTITEILDKCKISQSSGHEKISYLIENGLLVSNGDMSDGENGRKYQTAFNNIKMEIEKKSIVVKIQLKKIQLQESAILQVIQ
jgi:predicted transcriptional regulator